MNLDARLSNESRMQQMIEVTTYTGPRDVLDTLF